jgi:hypothetical protein
MILVFRLRTPQSLDVHDLLKLIRRCLNALIVGSLLSMWAVPDALAQRVQLPRATSPLTLMSFEQPDAASVWAGMKCAISTNNASEGKSALAIHFPKWDGGKDNQWLQACVSWGNGKGYAEQDWSHYGKLRFDGWVDGQEKLDICLELHGQKEGVSFTKELVVNPGEKNTFEFSLEDVGAVVDLKSVQSFGIYGIRPTRDAVLTIDNVTLLPGDKQPVAVLDLVYPNYRDLVFPGVTNIEVKADLQCEDYGISPQDVTLSLSATRKRTVMHAEARAASNSVLVSLPVKQFSKGDILLQARVVNNKSGVLLATNSWTVRKMDMTEASRLACYIDEANRFIVDGVPFFPIGWYGNTSLDHFDEIAGTAFNTLLPYGVNGKTKAFTKRYLDRVQAAGMKLIYCMNDIYPTATFYEKTGWEGIKGNSNIADAVVAAFKSHPAVIAWYLNDERPKELMPKFVDYYRQTLTNDPSHPCFIVIYNLSELKYFSSTTDILGVDRYPIPADPITSVTQEMQIAKEAVKGHKPVMAVIQTFGWYQYNKALPDRGRTPTEADLQSGRAPTAVETRNMAYQAIVNGANGLLFYCYYDLRVLPQYKEYWAQLKTLAAEIKTLSPVLLSTRKTTPVVCHPADCGVSTLVKNLDGELYLIAVNTSDKECKATMDVGVPIETKISVMFEGRFALDVQGTKLTDHFKPLEVHVYDLGQVGN